MSDVKLEDIVSLCKRRGFIYQGSEIYGGLAGTWDYGPLGVALKRNIMQLWWKMFVADRDDMLGVDAAILMNQKVWQASGHTETFTDPLMPCVNCGDRFRTDKLIEKHASIADYRKAIGAAYETMKDLENLGELPPEEGEGSNELFRFYTIDRRANEDFTKVYNINIEPGEDTKSVFQKTAKAIVKDLENAKTFIGFFPLYYLRSDKCPTCGNGTLRYSRSFNLMFETYIGSQRTEMAKSYLRPETAQGIFTNYKNVVDSFYPDVPFGIAQQGKAFRNEISPRDFVFRSREFEQMEIEYFVHPDKWEEAFEEWIKQVHAWCDALGLPAEKVHELEVADNDRAHYSKRTVDFEFDFPIGKEELLGLAYRTSFDLDNIQKATGKNMEYRPKDGGDPFVPHVIEPSFGVERAIMAVLTAAYNEDEQNGEKRIYLKLPNHLAPVKVAVSPLLKNKPELVAKARQVYAMLKKEFGAVMWDDNGNIGKRYRRQDEIGTPYCVVIDFETLEGDSRDTVTVRHRDTTEQTRVKITELAKKLLD